MGRIFEARWGGVREMAEALLRAAAPICAEQGRRIEVLVPRGGLCPLASPAVREVVLPRFGANRLLWDHITVRGYANRQSGAVLYNIKLVLPVVLRIPGFTTLTDLMYFPQPGKYDWREYLLADSLYMRVMIRRTVRAAAVTHAISEHTARDARELFPDVAPERFRAIPLAVEAKRWRPGAPSAEDEALWRDLEARGVVPPYVFYSGGLSQRKNVSLLARAFAPFRERHPEWRLVLTGGDKPTRPDPELAEALAALPAEACVRLGEVGPRAVALLYQRAGFFVFPSLYEGFGLPVLEAQAAGCPVACSKASSLPEVAGEGALLFDPRSPEDLLACMERLTQEGERARLRALGEDNLRRFSWERTARGWLDLADEAAGERIK